LAASASLHDRIGRLLGRRVAPKLRRAQHAAVAIERDETVLLAGNADRDDGFAHRRGHAGKARAQRVEPPAGMLLGLAALVAVEIERRRRRRRDRSLLEIVEQRLDALRAEVDAEYSLHLKKGCQTPISGKR